MGSSGAAVPTEGIGDGTVANDDLAPMVEATFKGRAAGAGSGAPTDLSAEDAAEILSGTFASPQGEYNPGTTYAVNDVVISGGGAYRALVTTTGVTPGTDALVWETWGAAGDFALQAQVFPYTIPIIANIAVALSGVALTSISGSNIYMEPADFSPPSGYAVQCRVMALITGAQVGDLLGVDIFDTTASVVVVPETAKIADSTGVVRVAGDWNTFPAVLRRGAVRAVNRTRVAGSTRIAWLEVQMVAV